MRIVFTQTATATIRHSIADLYANSPEAAKNLTIRIDATIGILRRYPELGRQGAEPGTRELVISKTRYILIYRLHPKHIEVLYVRHTSRKR